MDTPTRPGSDSGLLPISLYYLRRRDYSNCRSYAVQAQNYNPNQPGPVQVLAIASILSATRTLSKNRPDWYTILGLSVCNRDPNVMKERFCLLDNLLNPEKNPYPFAAEAHEWVIRAWAVLSNPTRKAHYDNNGATFWTACPYCYYIYEYEKFFENCCLMCQNGKCRRAFTAVPVAAEAVPPPEVAEKGKYTCYGFSPLVPENESGGEGKGWKWWGPLVSMGGSVRVLDDPNPGRVGEGHGNGVANEELMDERNKNDEFIEISDDEEQGKDEGKVEICEEEKNNDVAEKQKNDGNFEQVKNNGVEKEKNDANNCEQVKNDGGEKEKNDANGGKVVMKRKKMMAKATKKLMGRGVRVQSDEILQRKADDEAEDSDKEGDENGENVGVRGTNVGEKGACEGARLQLQVGDDDIFVGLDCDFEV